MAHWTTADLIPYVCRHINDVHTLAALSTVNKALNHYLFSTTGGRHWIHAGKLVCGEDYWPQDDLSRCLEQEDPRYLTKIRICPWISEPVEIDIDERVEIEHDRTPTENDKHILSRLNKTRWAPHSGKHYGMMEQIIKLHDSVSIVTSGSSSCYDQVFAYFIASKDLRLLRDRYYITSIAEPGYDELWNVMNGTLYTQMQESEDSISTVMRFGIRPDKLITPPPPPAFSAKTIQAFWSAFRGHVTEALDQLKIFLGNDVDIPHPTCHKQTLAQHIINGGSYNALKTLLNMEPSFVNEITFGHILRTGREDMAKLVLSKTNQNDLCSSGFIWSMLTNDKDELNHSTPITTGIDINQRTAWMWNMWKDQILFKPMPTSFRLLCTLCAQMRIPTSDGKQLVDIMREYTKQLMANYDEDHDESNVMLHYRVKSTMELLTANE